MRVAITGAAGLFGQALVAAFVRRHTVIPLTRPDAEMTDAGQVRTALERAQVEVVVHAANIPDMDLCEREPDKAHAVNVGGTRNVVEAARALGAGVVFISTDAVFDGEKDTPYTESDPPSPLTVYGRTKIEAEQAVAALAEHWIFRVPVLFGPGKTNFIERGLRKMAAGGEFVAASDQTSSTAYTVDAAETIAEVVGAKSRGLFHLCNQGATTRAALAQEAARLAGLDPGRVRGTPRAEMRRPARRARYGVLAMQTLEREGFKLPRPWPEALAQYVSKLGLLAE